jgi:hypothetical protein
MSSTLQFFNNQQTFKTAADACQSIAGRDSGRTDRCGFVTIPCIIAAMVTTNLLGKPTPWLVAHEFWHTLSKAQVKFMRRTVSRQFV